MAARTEEFDTWPPISFVDEDMGELDELARFWNGTGLLARIVRGDRMISLDRALGELAAALQFPWYFGNNLDALEECLTDIELPREFGGVVILVTSPDRVLSEEPIDVFRTFRSVLESVGASRERDDEASLPPQIRVVVSSRSTIERRRWASEVPR